VEDILALPQLKQGKFSKNVQQINIYQTVMEIVEIMGYQSETKCVQVQTLFTGFPE